MTALTPPITIVIPCKNEENYIAKCVNSIYNGHYPKEQLEVIVCDGKSTDDTLAVLNQLKKAFESLKVLINERETTPYALNLGIQNASADLIMILGAHAVLGKDYFVEAIAEMKSNKAIDVIGGVLNNVDENKTSASISKAMSSKMGVGTAHFRTGASSGFVDTVAFGLYKKEIFDTIGLFDESLTRNQDDEFNFRVSKAGFKMYLSKRLKLKYFVRGDYFKLAKQFHQYGYWKVFVNKKHRTITTIRQVFPMLLVSFTLVGWLMGAFYIPLLLLYFGVLIMYLALCAIAASKVSTGINETMGVIKAIIIMHWHYGKGYLKGIYDFVILNRKPAASSSKLTR